MLNWMPLSVYPNSVLTSLLVVVNSEDRSDAGVHAARREEPGSAAQLPSGLPQVSPGPHTVPTASPCYQHVMSWLLMYAHILCCTSWYLMYALILCCTSWYLMYALIVCCTSWYLMYALIVCRTSW